MIREYYRQMRKFGCDILAVVQQYDVIKDSPVRGAMIGNSKMFLTVGFQQLMLQDCHWVVGQKVAASSLLYASLHLISAASIC
jgi:hypothetical protein